LRRLGLLKRLRRENYIRVSLKCIGAYLNGVARRMQMCFTRQVRCVCFVVGSVLKKVDLVLAESGFEKAKFRVVCLYGNMCIILIDPDDEDGYRSGRNYYYESGLLLFKFRN